MNRDEAVVVLSGGQDSTTCLFWAKQKFKKIIALSYDYQQKNKNELKCAKEITKEFGIEHHIFDLSVLNSLTTNSLTRSELIVDKKIEKGKLPNTYVEGRNILFLLLAAIFAKTKGINLIITGVSQTDYSGYPDCRDIFIKSLQVTLSLAMNYEFEILTPLMWKDKKQTWEMADRLGIIDIVKNRTVTCYNGILGEGCGECLSCQLRKKGYEQFLKNKEHYNRK